MIKEIQVGLYQEIIYGSKVNYSKLYSEEGYCFYDATAEVYDEDGDLIPEGEIKNEQRQYFKLCYTPLITVEEINARFVSIPEYLI